MAQVYSAPIISQENDVYNHLLGTYRYIASGPELIRNEYAATYNNDVYMTVAFDDRLRAFFASKYPFRVVFANVYGDVDNVFTINSILSTNNIPKRYGIEYGGGSVAGIDPQFSSPYSYYNTSSEAINALIAVVPAATYIITYRLTNCTAPTAPTEATIGDTVTVPFQFTTGYGIVNPASDVYVTNNGVVVPSQYSNGVLTFTMPDPS